MPFEPGDIVVWDFGCVCVVVSTHFDGHNGILKHSDFCPKGDEISHITGGGYYLEGFVTKIDPFKAFVMETLAEAGK